MFFYNVIKYGSEIGARFFFNIDIKGLENIPADGPLIVCSNHSSNWDGVLIGIPFRKRILSFMAKKEMFKNKIIANILDRSFVISVDRSGSDITSLKRALKVLKDEKTLCIFPEGTRVSGYDESNAKAGIGMIAYRSKAPVLPVRLSFDSKFRSHATIIIGKPIVEHINVENKPSSAEYMELSKTILKNIYDLK